MTRASLARTLAPPLPTAIRFCARLVIRKPLGAVGVAIILGLLFVGLFADVLAPYDIWEMSIRRTNLPSGPEHLLGTDNIGRDQLTKLIYSARTTLLVGPGTVALSGLMAAALGLVAGYWGGKVDALSQRLVDAWMSFPDMVILISTALFLGPGLHSVLITIFVITAVSISRVVRSAVLKEKETAYLEAATAMGASHRRIMLLHLLPNVMSSILVIVALNVSHAVMLEAAVSFLGVGLPASIPSWGQMIRGRRAVLAPGLCLTAVIFAFNTVADALIDLTNPRNGAIVRRTN